jgi:hypothetical protein
VSMQQAEEALSLLDGSLQATSAAQAAGAT